MSLVSDRILELLISNDWLEDSYIWKLTATKRSALLDAIRTDLAIQYYYANLIRDLIADREIQANLDREFEEQWELDYHDEGM